MTRLILFPNEHAQINLEVPETAESLAAAINAGQWTPPGAELAGLIAPGLRAIRLGSQAVLAFLPAEPGADEAPPVTLSPRQQAILQGLAEGLNAGQIAARLGLSRRTIFMHLAELRLKLETPTTQEALIRAARLGLCAPAPRHPPRPRMQH